jgi:subtilisin family serine protease
VQVRAGLARAVRSTVERIEPRVLLDGSALPSYEQLKSMNAPQLAEVGVEQIEWRGTRSYARTDEFIVRAASDASRGSKMQTLRSRLTATLGTGFSSVTSLRGSDLYTLSTVGIENAEDLSRRLTKMKGFVRAEPNFIVWANATTPNDPSFSQLWGLHNTGQTGGVADADIDAVEAWDRTTGDGSVVVGVIDTGIDYTHPDLAANMWTNPGEVAGNNIDDDANGFVDDVYGADFVGTGDGNPMDDHYHGTHCAGTIGGVGNNGVGVTGVAWDVQLMALKFLSASGSGATADAIEAVNYATDMKQRGVNIRLTSNSWGGGGFSQALLDAINANAAADMLFVAAAGNNSSNTDVSTNYPSGYNSPNIVSVAALDHADALASFSNYGATTVDLGAPGVSVYSTSPGNSYRSLSGTSMATPHVAGAAALAFMASPAASASRVRDVLMASTVSVASLAGKAVTGGRLNLLNVLNQMGLQLTLQTPAAGTVQGTAPTSFTLKADADVAPTSVQATDLTVNGIAADSVTLVDAQTLRFDFNASPATTVGLQQVTVAAGVITRAADTQANVGLSATFYYDPSPLTVTSTTPANTSLVAMPLTVLGINFSKAIDATSVQASDLKLGFGTVSSVTVIDVDSIEFVVTNLSREGLLSLSILPGAIRDATGIPFAGYVGSLELDYGTVPMPAFASRQPRGGLVHESTTLGSVAANGDEDRFTANLDADQVAALVLRPDANLRGELELFGPGGTSIASAVATSAGEPIVLQTPGLSTAGVYTVRVAAADGSSGSYRLEWLLNSGVEDEAVGGPSNDTQAGAQDIAGTILALGAARRYAVLGTTAPGDVDWFDLPLTAGKPVSILVTGQVQGLEIYDAGGVRRAIAATATGGMSVAEFVPAASQTYALRVVGGTGDYQLEAGVSLALGRSTPSTAPQPLGRHQAAIGTAGGGSMSRLFAFDVSGNLIKELNVTTGAVINSFASPVSPSSAPDAGLATTGSSVLVAGNSSAAIYELNPNTGATLRTFANPGMTVSGLAFMKDEIFVLTDDVSTNNLAVLDYNTGAVKRRLTVVGPVESLASDGTRLLSTSSTTLYQIDPQTGATTTLVTLAGAQYTEGLGVIGNELFAGSSSAISVFDLSTYAFKRTLSGVSDLEGVGADGGTPADAWTLWVNAGDVVNLFTTTPADGAGVFDNLTDTRIEVLNPSNALVASDDNSAPDGRNASLSFTAAGSGRYVIRVSSTSTGGLYVLHTSGATGSQPAFAVSASNPANGASLSITPSTITVDFNAIFDPQTVQPDDLQIDGIAAGSVVLVDGDTLRFTPGAPLADTSHTLTIAAGSILDLNGTPISSFSATFGVLTAPRVVGSSVQQNGTVNTAAASSFTFDFNFDLLASGIDVSDIQLASTNNGSVVPTGVTYDPTILRLTVLVPALADDVWTLTLLSGNGRLEGTTGLDLDGEALAWPIPPNRSGDGTPGGNFVVRFYGDMAATSFPSLNGRGINGSLIRTGTTRASTGINDVDNYTIALNAGQTLSVSLDPASTLWSAIEVLDSAGAIISSVEAAEAGRDVLLQSVAIDVSGTYTIRVTGLDATHGTYTLAATLNADLEAENHDGPTNDTFGQAQDLGATRLEPIAGVWRAGVLGKTNLLAGQTVRDDFYSFPLTAGEPLDVIVTGPLQSIQLLNGAGQVLALGDVQGNKAKLGGFVAPAAGTYVLKLQATANGDYELLASNALLEAGDVTLGKHQALIGVGSESSTGRLYVFDAGGGMIRELNPLTGAVLRSFASPVGAASGPDAGLATTPDSLLVAGSFGQIYELNLNTGATLRTFNAGLSEVSGLAYGNGEVFVLSDSYNTYNIAVIDYATGLTKRTLLVSSVSEGLGFSRRGLLGSTGSSLVQIDVNTGATTSLGPVNSNEGIATVNGELFVGTGTSISVYDATTLAFKRSLSFSGDIEGLGGDESGGGAAKAFVRLTSGTTFTAKTHTPGDGPGVFPNNWNPKLELLDAAGTVVASDDNGAGDGKNALLSFTPTADGLYTIRVSTVGVATGWFVLSTTGVANQAPALRVSVVSPGDRTTPAVAPTAITLDFNQILDLATVSAADLLIDGVPASSVTPVDGNTLRFTLATPPGDGTHTVQLAQGAISALGGGLVEAFSSTFVLDVTGPKIDYASIQQDEVRNVGNVSLTFGFDRDITTTGLDSFDVTLVGTTSGSRQTSSFAYDPLTRRLTLTYTALPEDRWSLTLLSGNSRFEGITGADLDGEATAWPIPPNRSGNNVAGGNFVVGFSTDAQLLSVPLVASSSTEPWFSYSGQSTSQISNVDLSDDYLLNLEAGHTLSLLVDVSTSLGATLEIFDPSGASIATGGTGALGADVVVNALPVTASGAYRVVVSRQAGSGAFTFRGLLNTMIEPEQYGGPTNNTSATALDLTPISFDFGSNRAHTLVNGVLGPLPGDGVDWYKLDVQAGDVFGVTVTGSQVSGVNVYDASGAIVAAGTRAGSGLPFMVSGLPIDWAGPLYLSVQGSGSYTLAGARNLIFNGTALGSSNVAIGANRFGVGAISPSSQNTFTFNAAAGDTIQAQTFTPGSGVGDPVNDLDPRLELLGPTGQLIAANDNGAGDGRNALIFDRLPVAGLYTLRISSTTFASTSGRYALLLSGATGAVTPTLAVSSTLPSNGATVIWSPTATYMMNFSSTLDLRTVAAADLRFNGTPATAVTIVDGDTLQFAIPAIEGAVTVTMAADAIRGTNGASLGAFSASFTQEVSGPRVIDSTVQEGDTLAPASSHTFVFTVDKTLLNFYLDASDVTLVGATTGAKTVSLLLDATQKRVSVSASNLPEDVYTLTLLSGDTRFESSNGLDLDGETPAWPIPSNRSGDGVAGGNFAVTFVVDGVASPLSFTRATPEGSMVERAQTAGVISNANDDDGFFVTLEAGQQILAMMDATGSLAGELNILDSTGTSVATGVVGVAGQDLALSTPTLPAGTYQVVVGGAAGTVAGGYGLRVLINAVAENESFGAPANDTIATAEPIDGSLTDLPGGVRRSAVIGKLAATVATDVYSIDLSAGDVFNASVLSGAALTLQIQDAAGTVLATGTGGFVNLTSSATTVLPTTGRYYVVVTGATTGEYTLVSFVNAELEQEHNDNLPATHSLTGKTVVGGLSFTSGLANTMGIIQDQSPWGYSSNTTIAQSMGFNVTVIPSAQLGTINLSQFGVVLIAGNQSNSTYSAIALNIGRLESYVDAGGSLIVNYCAYTSTGVYNYDLLPGAAGMAFANTTGSSIDVLDPTHPVVNGPAGTITNTSLDGLNSSYHGYATTPVPTGGKAFLSTAIASQLTAFDYSFGRGRVTVNTMPVEVFSGSSAGMLTFHKNLFTFARTFAMPDVDGTLWNLSAGLTYTWTSQTPGDATGAPANTLDPKLELVGPDGVVVMSDDNSAGDGRNASLSFTPTVAGNYTLRVKAAGGSGVYMVTMASAVPVLPVSADLEFETRWALRVGFADAIDTASIAIDDLVVTHLASGATVTPASVEWSTDRTQIVWTFDESMPEGDYRFELAAGSLTTDDGRTLSTAQTWEGGANFVRLGDADRDRSVGFSDLLIMAQHFNSSGRTFSQGDFNHDGNVDFYDLLLLAQRYNQPMLLDARQARAESDMDTDTDTDTGLTDDEFGSLWSGLLIKA